MIPLPPYIDKEAWEGFEEMRIMIKRPMTDRARKLILKRLDSIRKAGHCPNESLDQSTEHNWQTVYEPKPLELTQRAGSGDSSAYLAEQRRHALEAAETPPERKAEIAAMLSKAKSAIRRVA